MKHIRRELKTVAILGAGNAGQTMAADIALRGFKVNLFELESFKGNIEYIAKNKEIKIDGVGPKGVAKLNKVTINIEEALKDAELIIVDAAVPGHDLIFKESLPYLKDNQVMVFATGYWASLRYRNALRKSGKKAIIAESTILPYICVIKEPGYVHVDGIKYGVPVAGFPATNNELVYDLMSQALPYYSPGQNTLQTNFENFNWVFHPPITILNTGLIERKKGDFTFYVEGAPPIVAHIVDKLDIERMKVGEALGLELVHTWEWLNRYYGAHGTDHYTSFHTCPAYQQSIYTHVLKDLKHANFLTEDINLGLVTVASFADALNIKVSLIKALIQIACELVDQNFWETGLTIEKLGLGEMDVDQIKKLFNGDI